MNGNLGDMQMVSDLIQELYDKALENNDSCTAYEIQRVLRGTLTWMLYDKLKVFPRDRVFTQDSDGEVMIWEKEDIPKNTGEYWDGGIQSICLWTLHLQDHWSTEVVTETMFVQVKFMREKYGRWI